MGVLDFATPAELIRSRQDMPIVDPAIQVIKHTETTLVRLQALVNGTTIQEARNALATKRREITLGPSPMAALHKALHESNGQKPTGA